MFPTKETGDYLNANSVFIKYNLDVADPEGLVKKYAVKAYPTFVILDGDGNEVNRFLGGASTPASFNERVADALNPENSYAARDARFKKDINYGGEYAAFLNDIYMSEKANEVLTTMYEARTLAENFAPESVAAYKPFIKSLDHKIFVDMTDKKLGKKIRKIMGKEEYAAYIQGIANEMIFGTLMNRRGIDKDALNSLLTTIEEKDALQSKFTDFVNENKELIISKDAALLDILITSIKEATSATSDYYANLSGLFFSNNTPADQKAKIAEILTIGAEKSTNERNKGSFAHYAKMMKQ